MSTDKPSRYLVTTDIVVFTVQQDELHLLLVERGHEPYKGALALPGGFVLPDEDLDTGARRELEEETGVKGYYLEQLYTFGYPGRDPRGRVVTVAYFALIRANQVRLQAGSDAISTQWVAISKLPRLAFDHDDIVAVARERLAAKLEYSTLAFQLLPDRFTIREVQAVYETILGRELDRRNFYKKILASGDLVETSERRVEGRHRPATVYRLKKPAGVRFTR